MRVRVRSGREPAGWRRGTSGCCPGSPTRGWSPSPTRSAAAAERLAATCGATAYPDLDAAARRRGRGRGLRLRAAVRARRRRSGPCSPAACRCSWRSRWPPTWTRPTELAAEIAERRACVTGTGYHWRCLDTVERAAALLADAPARLALGAWLDKVPPPAWWPSRALSGGQVVEQLTHVLDLARLLVGEVAEVHRGRLPARRLPRRRRRRHRGHGPLPRRRGRHVRRQLAAAGQAHRRRCARSRPAGWCWTCPSRSWSSSGTASGR